MKRANGCYLGAFLLVSLVIIILTFGY